MGEEEKGEISEEEVAPANENIHGRGLGDGEATAPDIAAAEGVDVPKDEGPAAEDAKGKRAAKRNLEKPDS